MSTFRAIDRWVGPKHPVFSAARHICRHLLIVFSALNVARPTTVNLLSVRPSARPSVRPSVSYTTCALSL